MRTKYETNIVSKFLPLYGLSKIIPVHMSSCYTVSSDQGGDDGCVEYVPECATWWQWRGRVWKHKQFSDKYGW